MNDIVAYRSSRSLPQPRKLPKQGRSRILVESLKQACVQILQREGHQALTATRIASVSGVAMGSLYQYFPNVDAIVVATLDDLVRAHGANFLETQPQLSPTDLSELINCVLKLSNLSIATGGSDSE